MPKKILVIDDDSEILLLEHTILSEAGFAVETVSDGLEALDKLKGTKYDGIVLDLNMPGIDGYEIARRIKELKGLDSNKSTPIIMVSGTSDRDARTRGFAEGIVVFLNKPFSPADFRRMVKSIVG